MRHGLNHLPFMNRVTGAILPHQNILNAFYTKDAEAGYQEMLGHLTQAFKDIVKK